jgi:prohibitin 2
MKKLILALTSVLALSACGFETVDTGNRGVETRFGEVVSESLPEGFYTYNPFTSEIIEMDTRVQRVDGSENTYTKDVQLAKLNFTVNFNLKRDKVHIVYREVGRDWQEKLVAPVVNGAVKSAIGKWDAVELIANRDKATSAIREALTRELDQKNVTVVGLEITDISFQPAFEKSVEDKVKAVQEAIRAQNETVRIKEEANQRVITAKAEAEAIRIRGEALAQNSSLVDYEAVKKWDGKLPQYNLGGATPFINLSPSK